MRSDQHPVMRANVLADVKTYTHADAILDRIVLKGESMRKMKAKGGGSPTAQP